MSVYPDNEELDAEIVKYPNLPYTITVRVTPEDGDTIPPPMDPPESWVNARQIVSELDPQSDPPTIFNDATSISFDGMALANDVEVVMTSL